MALPMPWNIRKAISAVPEGEKAHRVDETAITKLPWINMRFLPVISASLPTGIRQTAEDRRKAMDTQLRATAPMESSLPIRGRPIFTATIMKGLRNEATRVISRRVFLLTDGFDSERSAGILGYFFHRKFPGGKL